MFHDQVIDTELFSRIVGDIYDCVLDPPRWIGTLSRIASIMRSAGTSIVINDDFDTRGGRIYEHGADQKYLRLFFERHATADLRPVVEQRQRLGIPTTLEALGQDQPQAKDFFRDFVQPLGFNDVVALQLLRSGRRVGWLSASRSEIQPRFAERERRLISLLSPHLCQALALSDAIDITTVAANQLERSVDALSSGVFLADTAGRIVFMNRSAERQIKTGDALQLVNQRLTATDRGADAALARALAAAKTCTAAGERHGDGMVALPDGTGAGYVAGVLPLDGGARRELTAPFGASTAVFVQDPLAAPRTEGEAFARLYGLTGAELKVLLKVAPGLTAKQAARELGLRESTIKTHLQRIYDKTGMNGQSELVRLLRAHVPPVHWS